MDGWEAVCEFRQLREGRGLGVEVDGLGLAVFREGEAVHVLTARCPHANGPLDRGWIDGGEAVCPLHHWRFRLATGRCTSVGGYSVGRFEAEIRDGWVWARLGSPGLRARC
ncbi:MAG: Rieske 2Fe-2S domain-containing protein [Isosphaeraceae bacterium]